MVQHPSPKRARKNSSRSGSRAASSPAADGIRTIFAFGPPASSTKRRPTVVDASENDELRAHVSDLLVRWQGVAAQIYIKFGASPAVADEHGTVLLAALEGALILARAHRSTAPLDTVERYFAVYRAGRRQAEAALAPGRTA